MKNSSTSIDLKQINDPDNRITIASAEGIYSQITDWIKNGMNADDNKCASLIMFAHKNKNEMICDALNLGNGKTYMDSLTQLVIKGFKTSIPNGKNRISEVILHCAKVLDSVTEFEEDNDISKICGLLAVLAIVYAGDSSDK